MMAGSRVLPHVTPAQAGGHHWQPETNRQVMDSRLRGNDELRVELGGRTA